MDLASMEKKDALDKRRDSMTIFLYEMTIANGIPLKRSEKIPVPTIWSCGGMSICAPSGQEMTLV